jgi:hypothetical protein
MAISNVSLKLFGHKFVSKFSGGCRVSDKLLGLSQHVASVK